MPEPSDLAEVVAAFRASGGRVENYLSPETNERVLRLCVGTGDPALAAEIAARLDEARRRIKPKPLDRLATGYEPFHATPVPYEAAVAFLKEHTA